MTSAASVQSNGIRTNADRNRRQRLRSSKTGLRSDCLRAVVLASGAITRIDTVAFAQIVRGLH